MGVVEIQDFARICDDVVIIRYVFLNTTSRKYQTEKHAPDLRTEDHCLIRQLTLSSRWRRLVGSWAGSVGQGGVGIPRS